MLHAEETACAVIRQPAQGPTAAAWALTLHHDSLSHPRAGRLAQGLVGQVHLATLTIVSSLNERLQGYAEGK